MQDPNPPENPFRPPDADLRDRDTVPPARSTGDEVVATVVPYKNPQALIAYYLGLFSISGLIPILGVAGVAMAIVAIFLGVKGLRFATNNVHARGKVHAWIGVVCGSLFGSLGALMQAGMLLVFLSDN